MGPDLQGLPGPHNRLYGSDLASGSPTGPRSPNKYRKLLEQASRFQHYHGRPWVPFQIPGPDFWSGGPCGPTTTNDPNWFCRVGTVKSSFDWFLLCWSHSFHLVNMGFKEHIYYRNHLIILQHQSMNFIPSSIQSSVWHVLKHHRTVGRFRFSSHLIHSLETKQHCNKNLYSPVIANSNWFFLFLFSSRLILN